MLKDLVLKSISLNCIFKEKGLPGQLNREGSVILILRTEFLRSLVLKLLRILLLYNNDAWNRDDRILKLRR
jgi:hypothetical protein